MTRRLEGKAALVIGAGSRGPGWGNGKASAVLMAREGARVVCVDQDGDAARETAELIRAEGGTGMSLQADATDERQVREIVQATVSAHGGVDVLFNNVGIAIVGTVVDMSEADWDKAFAVNVKSCFLSMKHVIPHMIQKGGGSIVNMSSTAALRHTGKAYATYYATKAAVSHLTRTTAVDFAPRNVRVNSVAPGYMMTPMVETVNGQVRPAEELETLRQSRATRVPMKRQGDAWDVAEAVVYLASDASGYVTGTEIVIDGGITLKF